MLRSTGSERQTTQARQMKVEQEEVIDQELRIISKHDGAALLDTAIRTFTLYSAARVVLRSVAVLRGLCCCCCCSRSVCSV